VSKDEYWFESLKIKILFMRADNVFETC
jgi:hypothetical protein